MLVLVAIIDHRKKNKTFRLRVFVRETVLATLFSETAHRFEHERIWSKNANELPNNCLSKIPDYS